VNEKQYLISVLLRAREQISQVAQKAAKALDEVTKSQDRMSESSKLAAKAAQEQRGALQHLHDARIREKRGLDESAAAMRSQARSVRENTAALREQSRQVRASADSLRAQRDAAVKANIESLREAASLRDLARARAEQVGAIDKTARQLTRQAEAVRREADQNRRLASSYEQSIRAIERRASSIERDAQVMERGAVSADKAAAAHERASSAISRSVITITRQIASLDERQASTARSTTGFTRALERIGLSSTSVASNLRGLNAEFQGLAIAFVIKYAQSLVSVLVALAAQLVAVTAAAGQAAVAIGAALGAGMAQAIPVVGVLAATFARLTSVLKVVKLQNDQQQQSTRDAAAAARTQRAATESIRSAEERVADAHRNTARAVQSLTQTRSDAAREMIRAQQEVTQAEQESARNIASAQAEVTKARKDAIRTVQDLIAAEEQAQQTVEQAQASLRAAVRSGDVAAVAQAQIDVGQAQVGQRRAREDVAPVRARGVEGVEGVIQAEQRLAEVRRRSHRQVIDAERRLGDVRRSNNRQIAEAARAVTDARRQETRATDDLARTRRTAAENVAQETAAVNKLTDALKLLSPAERDLYRRILRLQEVYRRVARPITDILVRAFSDVVDRVTTLIQDPRILRGFRNIAVQIAASIRAATREAGGEESIGAFQILSAEAARNIPTVSRILTNLFRTIRDLILDALPAFRLLLTYVDDYTTQLRDFVSGNANGLRDFFLEGIEAANAFFKLGLAVLRLFLALAGPGGGAEEGVTTVEQLTGMIDGLTKKVRANAGQVREFFGQTRDVLFAVLSVIGTIGRTMIDVFSAKSVSELADFLNLVIIPALGNVVEILGALVTLFHQLFSLPGFAQFAQIAATFLLLGTALTIIKLAVFDILAVVPRFLRAFGLMGAAGKGAAVGIAAITTGGWVVLAIGAIIAAVVLLDKQFHFLGPTFRWLKNAASDTFDWIKEAGRDVASWFSDVWTQGLLSWLRWPFVKFFRFLEDIGVFEEIKRGFQSIVNWFSAEGGVWANLRTVIAAPFKVAWGVIRGVFEIIQGAVLIFLDLIAGRFDRIGGKISSTWDSIFGAMYETTAAILNAIIAGINLAIQAFNTLKPGPKVPRIGFHMPESYEAKKTLEAAKRGERVSGYEGPHAEGGYLPAKPGGRYIKVSEAGHDEVVITTDPRHGQRQQQLLGQLLEKAPHLLNQFAAGGWVQGARPTPSGAPITRLAEMLFKRGFSATSGVRDTTTYHGSGQAVDFGDSVNNLRALWSTVFPMRSRFAELFGPTYLRQGGLYHGTQKFIDPGLQRDHQDHIHIAMLSGVLRRLAGAARNIAGAIIQLPRALAQSAARTLGGRPTREKSGIAFGPLSALFSAGVDIIRDMRGQVAPDTGATTLPLGRGPAARKIFDYFKGRGFSGVQAAAWVGNFQQESALNPGAIQRGGPGRGLAQWGGGRFTALQQFAARRKKPWQDMQTQLDFVWHELMGTESTAYRAIRAARTLKAAVDAIGRLYERFGISGDRLGPAQAAYDAFANRAKGGRYAFGGAVLGYGGGDVHPRWLEGGEHVWRKDEVARAGGHGAMYAMRRMLGGGTSSSGDGYQRGGPAKGIDAPVVGRRNITPSLWLRIALAPAMEKVNELFSDISDVLESITRRSLRRSKRLALRIQRAFERLTEDGGVLDQIHEAVSAIATRGALRMQQHEFRVGPGGPTRAAIGEIERAQISMQTLQETRTGLGQERESIRDSIAAARRSIREAQRRRNKKAETIARTALADLQERLDQNTADLAQNAQDQVEAIESFQQALLQSINTAADNASSSLDRVARTAKAFGRSIDPNQIIAAQIGNMQNQMKSLEGLLGYAMHTGNVELTHQIWAQIEELYVTIAEAAAQAFQNSIDAVNNAAQQQTARIDRAVRRSQIGRVDYGALQSGLEARGGIMRTQRAGLQALMNQAAAAGNIEQFESLADQIDELDTALLENTQAIRDNTDAAFNFRTQQINEAAGFAQSVFSGAQGFFQALTETAGIDTLPQQLSILQGTAVSLATQQRGLLGQLSALTGTNLGGLRGQDLVNYLLSITSGPAFDAVMARLDPTQQQSFKDLVTGLLANATAVEQNTKAVTELTGATTQSFTSSFWSAFRTAIFTGTGKLLPQYATTVPTAQIGARVLNTGMLMVHAGETVRPAGINRDWRDGKGDVYNLNVTSPTQVLDPVNVNRQLAFLRKTSGR